MVENEDIKNEESFDKYLKSFSYDRPITFNMLIDPVICDQVSDPWETSQVR